ncbi:MAG TPA: iron-containing alcohol dehydrogenase [Burkholderiaceae bacterium]|nr:iron-containing alcohol dehydrogenase [Burkholderiaceae bacterium]
MVRAEHPDPLIALPIDTARGGIVLLSAQERVVLGVPAAQAVLAEAERAGAQRVFVTSGASLSRLSDGPLQRIESTLGPRLAGRYVGIRAHSPRDDVVAAARAARDAGADLLVAVGGGSVIDATKAMLMCVWHGLYDAPALEPYRHRAGGAAAVIDDGGLSLRMIAVSTTLSASEFTSTAGVSDAHTKQSFRHRLFVPRAAVLDPAATSHTPLPLLLATGMRAVDHAIESYCAPSVHAIGEAHALLGLALLARALPAIAREPAALAPRRDAQIGMWQASLGSATGAGTGASHGIGYALGATFDVAHGHTSCVMLPAVLAWNEPVNGDRQAVLAAQMGRAGEPLSRVVAELVRSLGLPSTLRELSIDDQGLREIARRALDYEPVQRNPRPIRSADDVMEILRLAL